MSNTVKQLEVPEKLYYTNKKFQQDLLDIARQIAKDNWKPDLIIGPARGGLIPAVYMSHYFDVKMAPVCLSLRDFKTEPEDWHIPVQDLSKFKNILIVDDMIDSGATFKFLVSLIKERYYNDLKNNKSMQYEIEVTAEGSRIANKLDLRSAVLFHNISNEHYQLPTYYVNAIDKEKDNRWLVFPYEEWWGYEVNQ